MKPIFAVFCTLSIAALMVVSIPAFASACTDSCVDEQSAGLPMVFTLSPEGTHYVPWCEEVTFTYTASDCDCNCCGWSIIPHACSDEIDVDPWPGDEWIDELTGDYRGSYTVRKAPGETLELAVTATDAGCKEDGPITRTATVTWVGIDKIEGRDRLCPSSSGAQETYRVVTKPLGHTDMLDSLTVSGVEDYSTNGGSVTITVPSSAGNVTITAEMGECTVTKTIYVGTTPAPNRVPVIGGGSSCCGSGGLPAPSIMQPLVEPGPPCCECGDDDTVVDIGCSYIASLYTDSRGAEHPVLSEDPTNIGDGVTVTRQYSGSTTTGYTKTDAAGNTTVYGPPVKLGSGGSEAYSRKISVTDADGRETIYDRDTNGALDYTELPNGDIWEYEHTLSSPAEAVTWITKITAPDQTYTTIAYKTSGPALGKVSAVAQYDASDNLLSETEYTYDDQTQYDSGRLLSTDVNGHVVTYAYTGNTIAMTDTSADPDIVTVYAYGDGMTTVTRKHATDSNLDQTTTHYFHKLDGQNAYLWKVQDPTGALTYYGTYVPTDAAVGGTASEDYIKTDDPDLVGKVFRVEDAVGSVTEHAYDSGNGALLSVTYPEVDSITPTETYQYYGTTRWLKTVENVRGNFTHYVRNSGSLHQVAAIKVDDEDHADWSGVAAIKTHDYYTSQESALQVGLLETETVADTDGSEDYYKTYVYTNGNRLEPGPTSVTYRWGNGPDSTQYSDKTEYTAYDAMGRVLSTTDANNRAISNTYDAQGRQLTTTYGASGPYTESHYNCCVLEWTRDEEGRYTYYAYDDAKRVVKTWTSATGQSATDPLVEYVYDCFGNVHTVTTYSDANTARVTTYTYDKNGRVTRIDYPTVSQGQDPLAPEEFGYDEVGNLLAKRIVSTGESKATLYKYDALNRLTDVYYVANYTGSLTSPTYPQTPDVTYTYVGGSRLRETMTDAHSIRPTRYTYDLQDRLVTYKPATPRTLGQEEQYDTDVRQIGYIYNALGQKTNVILTEGSSTVLDVDYLYYANGWLKEVQENSTSIAEYTYDEVGNRTRVDLHNGTYTTYDYSGTDPRYFLDEIGHYGSDDELLMDYPIAYDTRDDSGNPNVIADWDNPGGRAYTYDANNRLSSAAGTSYGYDWVGNRLNPPANPSPMTYDKTDKLLLWPGVQSFTYYATGSLHEQKNAAGTTVLKIHSYTDAELLSQVVHGDDAQTDPKSLMEWDADSNRVSFTRSTTPIGTWDFVYDTTAGIPAVIEEVTPSGSVYYIREPGGALIARRDGATTNYYHFDALGSTRMLTNGSGTVTDTYTYDAWGKQIASTGSTAQPYRFVGQLGYYSHYQDSNLFCQNGYQSLQLGIRFYDTLAGRFTQVDPMLSRDSSFIYAASNPASALDPTGFQDIRDVPGIGDLADWLTEGRFCLDSSCHDNKYVKDKSGGILGIRQMGQSGYGLHDPPEPMYYRGPSGLSPCFTRVDIQVCYRVDAIDIPSGLPIIYDGIPQRPRKDPEQYVLKIPNRGKCTMTCNKDRPDTKPKISCTWKDRNHPVEWERR